MVTLPPVMRRLAGFGLLVVVTGCSGATPAAGPGTLPPVAAAVAPPTSVPVSPSVEPVEKPALADEATEAGAEAFARYWMAVRNEAYVTLDPTRLQAISRRGCATCEAYVESLSQARSEGRTYRGGQSAVLSAVASPGLLKGKALVLVNYDLDDLVVSGPAGPAERTVAGGRNLSLRFDLLWRAGQWTALQVSPT